MKIFTFLIAVPLMAFASPQKNTSSQTSDEAKIGYFEEKILIKDISQPLIKKNKFNTLGLQKKAENERRWLDCANLAKQNLVNFVVVRPWILISWLKCSREVSDDKVSVSYLEKAIADVEKHEGVSAGYIWSAALNGELVKARFALIDKIQKIKQGNIWPQVEALWNLEELLDKSQKAKLHLIAAESAQAKGELRAALNFYQNSLLEQENKSVREKLNSVLLALNETKESEKKEENGIEAEGGFEDRFKTSIKGNDLISLLEDCIAYLKFYPGGRKAKWANDKILEIYLGIFDQLQVSSEQNKFKDLRDRALSAMERTDSLRLADWAKILHKRLDLEGSLRFSEKALEYLGSSSTSASLVYIAGRSAEMLGDYKKAKRHFENYMEQFAGGEDLSEVTFRLALSFLRMGQASSAIATLEKLLNLKNIDKYELSAKYWLARSYQATNNTKALALIDEIVQKYPFSYYGLRLRIERTSGSLEWPTSLKLDREIKTHFYLNPVHRQAFKRLEILAEQEWYLEATQELGQIPLPRDKWAKLAYAKKLADMGLFPRVVRMINEIGDMDSELRSLDVVSLALPLIYKGSIEEQATKNHLSPVLIRSLIRQESAFGPKAISSSNALGLMQLIAPTAQEVATELGLKGLNIPEDVYQPETNIQMGSYYLAKVIRLFGGNVPFGLAAYNAGPQRLKYFVYARKEVAQQMEHHSSDPLDEMWFDELPWFESSFYVKAILRNVIMYRLAEKAQSASPDERRVQFDSVMWSQLVNN